MDQPTNPIWKQNLQFKGLDLHKYDKLFLEVWDYDSPTKSDIIGIGEVSLKSFKIGNNQKMRIKN